MGTPSISSHDLNSFIPESHRGHVQELLDRGYLFKGFYCAENGQKNDDYREWFAFIWKDLDGNTYRTEQPRTGSVECDVTRIG